MNDTTGPIIIIAFAVGYLIGLFIKSRGKDD